MQLLKQVVGIDVASDSFVTATGTIDIQQTIDISSHSSHKNTVAGFQQLDKAIKRSQKHVLEQAGLEPEQLPLWIVMEATGVYYERLALWLIERGYQVVVVLPNKIKSHAKSDNRKSKTDRIDAEIIASYGLEKALKPWQPASATMRELKGLVREHDMTTGEMTQVSNRLHALTHAASAPKHTLKRLRRQRDFLKRQLKEIEKEIKELIKGDPELKKSAECLDSVPGVAILTAAKVLAETNCFALVEHKNQVVSFAGMDPKERQSGTFKGKVMISHQGNRLLRHALYMPALAAIRKDPAMRALYLRVVERTSIKMKGVVAVMRKLLVLMYTLWKKNQMFDPTFQMSMTAA